MSIHPYIYSSSAADPLQITEALSVDKFAAKLTPKKVTIVNLSAVESKPVFVAREEKVNLFVIKQFGGFGLQRDLLALTRSAFDILKGRKFQHISVPKMLAYGPSLKENMGYIATSYLDGKDFLAHFEKLKKLPKGSAERESYLAEIKPLYEKAGRGLAELHNLEIRAGESETYIEEVGGMIEALHFFAIDKLKKMNVKLPEAVTDLAPFLASLKRNPGPTTFAHGDAYIKNFVSDGTQVGIIDFDSMRRSIGHEKSPIGLPATDTQQFLSSVSVCGRLFDLEPQEIKTLCDAFEKSYYSQFQGTHTEESKNFFRLYWLYFGMTDAQDKESLVAHAAEYSSVFAAKKPS